MKATVILLIVSLLIISAVTVTAQQDSTDHQMALEKYQAMQRSGIGLTIAGVPMAVGGLIISIKGISELEPSPGRFTLSERLTTVLQLWVWLAQY